MTGVPDTLSFTFPSRDIPVKGRVDVLVLGGGVTGVVAAIAAARAGASVCLVERNSHLGGTYTAAHLGTAMTFHASEDHQIVRGIGEELFQAMGPEGGFIGHLPDPLGVVATVTPYDPEIYRKTATDWVRRHKVTVLLHSQVIEVMKISENLRGVVVAGKGGLQALEAKFFIDCTGDGDVAAQASVPFTYGDGTHAQPMTMLFRVGGINREKIFTYMEKHPEEFVLARDPAELRQWPIMAVSGFFSQINQAKKEGRLNVPRDRVLFFEGVRPGEAVMNMTRVTGRDATDPQALSLAEMEGLDQAHEVFRFLKRDVPGFEQARLLSVASHIGVRETRHIQGHYTLDTDTILTAKKHDDGVAACAWPIDIHSPTDAGLVCEPLPPGSYYTIPWRCLLPVGANNLLVAGRCISSTHAANASCRVTPTCMALGQAAGAGAALMVKNGLRTTTALDVDYLRQRLKMDGAVVE